MSISYNIYGAGAISGNITDEIIQQYIEEQKGEPVEVSQFQIDSIL